MIDFATGEVIQSPQVPFTGFGLILRGRATLCAIGRGNEPIQVGEIGAGECFGDQISTAGSSGDLTITATEDLKVMVFDSKTMNELLNQSPTLAAEVGDAIEARRTASWAARYGKAV